MPRDLLEIQQPRDLLQEPSAKADSALALPPSVAANVARARARPDVSPITRQLWFIALGLGKGAGLLKIWIDNFRNREQKAQEQRRRWITIGLTFGLFAMVLLSTVAWNQRNSALISKANAVAEANARATAQFEAEESKAETEKQALLTYSNQLVAQSSAHLSDQLDLALLLSAKCRP